MAKKTADELRREKRKAETIDRNLAIAQLGESVERLESDPVLSRFFFEYEQTRLDKLLELKPSDDEPRRDIATEMVAMRSLRQHMHECTRKGRAARKTLDKLNSET